MKFGVGFIPSYSRDFKRFTDVDSFIAPLEPIENINGVPHVKGDDHYHHPLAPFLSVNKQANLEFDTADFRSKVFTSLKEAEKYQDKMELIFWRTPRHIKYFEFDE